MPRNPRRRRPKNATSSPSSALLRQPLAGAPSAGLPPSPAGSSRSIHGLNHALHGQAEAQESGSRTQLDGCSQHDPSWLDQAVEPSST
ncbi:hypothetical protein F511_18863 [Dorcoceras hygrometricum]|uniref:Uncharacterized protein n=1 Tax=Dorcoceras hygrometricum TaxID=472368 RepID=A0A2Z7ADD4_9LAMI|nr:hypothetical protein F511_18863 [Dorcoceras hygrometricum]